MATTQPHPPILTTRPPEPDRHHEVHNPVRDDAKLAPTEDLDREPDGVPHNVVGLTALFSVMLAMLVAFMFLTGHTVGKTLAILLAVIAIPTMVATLRKKAAVGRDDAPPSR